MDEEMAFLRARLDEDEGRFKAWAEPGSGHDAAGRGLAARMLREVQAKRAILADSLAQEHFLDDGEWYGCAAIAHHPAGQPTGRDCTCGRDEEVERRLRHLTAVYSDHPDYRLLGGGQHVAEGGVGPAG